MLIRNIIIFTFLFTTLLHASKPNIDKIIIYKSQRMMHLLKSDKVIKSYRIALGSNAKGPKEREGDRRTPEGLYKISGKNPYSKFYKSFRISYPNAHDIARAKKLGVNPGGDIMIHGLHKAFAYLGKLHLQYDWTLGCIAVTNAEIDEMWQLVEPGTVVEIKA